MQKMTLYKGFHDGQTDRQTDTDGKAVYSTVQ